MDPSHYHSAYVRRRWKVAALLSAVALGAWDLAVGLALGGIACSQAMSERLPLGSPLLGGLTLALGVAIPMTVATFRTVGSMPRADRSMVVAGGLLAIWTILQSWLFVGHEWMQPASALTGVSIASLGMLDIAPGRSWNIYMATQLTPHQTR